MRANCLWYHVVAGDTMGNISHYYRVNIWIIARANSIRNINLIYVGQNFCIPHAAKRAISGIQSNGKVRWYAYNALEWSNRRQTNTLIRRAATRHGLSANLMLAIAWQESGWTQHVIARDGGIGVMQVMPYTAQSLNRQVHGHYDPYKLGDNIELGAIYLKSLSHGFHGNLTRIISAYNEGGWNVEHRGIFNWPYVRNVRVLMYRY
jgi:Transglycosylase SLT domain/LysM domain